MFRRAGCRQSRELRKLSQITTPEIYGLKRITSAIIVVRVSFRPMVVKQ